MKRKVSFSGSFYPSDPNEIARYYEHFQNISKEHFDLSIWSNKRIPAIVVPHAGYVYSGFTAHLAFRVLQQQAPRVVVVIGPSHHHYFQGISVAALTEYETPFGELLIDTNLVASLEDNLGLTYIPEAHAEHSTEVQMPFIKYYHPNTKVVELVYSDTSIKAITKVLKYLLDQEGVMAVISTDLSHFYTLKEANYLDTICIDSFKRLDTGRLHEGCEACGILGLEAMMHVAKAKGFHTELLDYRTSADASDDRTRVVGYMSGLFIDN